MSFLAHLNPAGKILYGLLAFLAWDHFYCCFDLCFQVRDTLGVVDIDLVLNISPKIKILGGLSLVNTVTTAGHTCANESVRKTLL